MILVGWLRRFTVLGRKLDECATCGVVGPHLLGRKVWWGTMFGIPVLLLGFHHGMVCNDCGAWTGVRVDRMWRGLRSGFLPLDRPRPNYAAMPPDESGVKADAATLMDPIQVVAKRSRWDLYLIAWPVIVVALVVAGILLTPHTRYGSTYSSKLQDQYGEAHDCWLETDGSIAGCRLDSGVMMGTVSTAHTICYFNEPEEQGSEKLTCDP